MKPETQCRYFSGYKPCSVNPEPCSSLCSKKSVPTQYVAIVHLGALGAVLRSTALLSLIHKKFPGCSISWITQAPAHHLLKNNPLIDRIVDIGSAERLQLKALEFDAVFCIDKCLTAAGVVSELRYKKLFGFKAHSRGGAIVPATEAAMELWSLGLDNHKKFYENKKSEIQLMQEALELSGQETPEYNYFLTAAEEQLVNERRQQWLNRASGNAIIGINTGCADTIPYKKLSIEGHRNLIKAIQQKYKDPIVLLGGPTDHERNLQIANGLQNVTLSEVNKGMRDGMLSVAACDIVVTGDSLGMHMAISQKKWVIAWFGPTCSHEIELYGRGVKIESPLSCSPCWKRFCQQSPMCYDSISLNQLLNAIQEGMKWRLKKDSLSRRHLLETPFSPSPC